MIDYSQLIIPTMISIISTLIILYLDEWEKDRRDLLCNRNYADVHWNNHKKRMYSFQRKLLSTFILFITLITIINMVY